ncbi:metal-dependent hydrolase [Acinetobacter bereziniae]|uniref:metal-dependent hydrolase n=1 Tax=Acinetobacter bereziniae TaxID=106648 RepID=UPI0018FF74FA|nr:metal-dependent hydrolase [Acinetobacter bereziniae]MBJ8554439.1 metal-dependent hydrolase [Acinetobacter bereziniae]
MFIAHLPSGYILARVLHQKFKQTKISHKAFFSIIMLGAIFPDIDLFYFYLFDHRSVHHHKYFLHWFSFWIPIFVIALIYLVKTKYNSKIAWMFSLFASAALLHIFLDTFVGDVWLFAPFIDQPYVFFEVSARYQPWWLNFIFHWSFFVEILICIIALILFIQKRKKLKKSI